MLLSGMPAANPTHRKSILEMLGEFLREAGVLVLVFGFLDTFMAEKAVNFWLAMGIFSVSGFLLANGILVEVARKE